MGSIEGMGVLGGGEGCLHVLSLGFVGLALGSWDKNTWGFVVAAFSAHGLDLPIKGHRDGVCNEVTRFGRKEESFELVLRVYISLRDWAALVVRFV